MPLFEIEIKSLLGTKDQADLLIEKLKNTDPDLQILGSHSQLNHYFTGGDLMLLRQTRLELRQLDIELQDL
jgi:hypothetical protein